MKPGLLIGIAAAVGGLLMLKPSGASAKPAPKPGEPGGTPGSALPGASVIPPADVVQKVLLALQSGDPKKMRATADELERAGYAAQAADLRGAAAQAEKLQGGAQSPGLPSLPSTGTGGGSSAPVVVPVPVPLPPAPVPPSVPSSNTPEQDLAARTALMLNTRGRGTEDKTLVAKFQTSEQSAGYYTGKIDGLYGPKTALCFAKHWAIVPPKPMYWPKVKAEEQKAKADWRSQMLHIAKQDPQRADEWTRVAAV